MWKTTVAVVSLALTMTQSLAATDSRPGGPERAQSEELAGTRIAASKTYRFANIFPFAVQIKVHGDGPAFPQVVNVPAGGSSVPIPYPNTSMNIQIKKPTGGWSPKFTIPWKSGLISLPTF